MARLPFFFALLALLVHVLAAAPVAIGQHSDATTLLESNDIAASVKMAPKCKQCRKFFRKCKRDCDGDRTCLEEVCKLGFRNCKAVCVK